MDTSSVIAAQLVQRRLNGRDKALQEKLREAPIDLPMQELTPENVASLMTQLQQARSPQERAALQAELDRLREMARDLHYTPPQPEPMPDRPIYQQMPYDPATQAPGIFGGTPPPRRMTY